MALVELAATMKSAALFAAEEMGSHGGLAIRMRPLSRDEAMILGLPEDASWAWALCQPRAGQPDALIKGGVSDSYSAASAAGHAELRNRNAQRDMQRAGVAYVTCPPRTTAPVVTSPARSPRSASKRSSQARRRAAATS